MKRCLVVLAVLVCGCGLFAGCSQQCAWTYSEEPPVESNPIYDKVVAVPPLADRRVQNSNADNIAIGYIPLVPYGWQDYNTPEAAGGHVTSGLWIFKPTEDFAKAIANELRNSGIFKDVYFTYKPSDSDLVLRGDIKSTHFRGQHYTACLSVAAPVLWLIGVPFGSATNELELDLRLVNTTTRQVLWKYSGKREKTMTSWIYSINSDFYYNQLLKEMMRDALNSLRNTFRPR